MNYLPTNLKSRIYIVLAAILWGTTGTTQALIQSELDSSNYDVNPIVLGTIRILLSGFFLSIIAVALDTKDKYIDFWHLFYIKDVHIAALCMALYQIFFFLAVDLDDGVGIAVGTSIALGSAPFIVGFYRLIFEKNNPSRYWWLFSFVSIFGLFLATNLSAGFWNIAFALGAGATYAFFILLSQASIIKYGHITVMGAIFSLGAILSVSVIVLLMLLSKLGFTDGAGNIHPEDFNWLITLPGIAGSLWLGLAVTAIAYVFFGKGLEDTSNTTAASLTLIEPLVAVLLGVFVLNEYLTPINKIGLGLLGLGVVSITTNQKIDIDKGGAQRKEKVHA